MTIKGTLNKCTGIADRLGQQHGLSVAPPNEDIVRRVSVSRPRVHPGGLLSCRDAEEEVDQDEPVFCPVCLHSGISLNYDYTEPLKINIVLARKSFNLNEFRRNSLMGIFIKFGLLRPRSSSCEMCQQKTASVMSPEIGEAIGVPFTCP
nr:unnamed protein product [Spirometra erinaceieuropaei]